MYFPNIVAEADVLAANALSAEELFVETIRSFLDGAVAAPAGAAIRS